MEKSEKSRKHADVRQLAPDEIDVVSGGLIKDEIRVVCGSIATINGTTYIGGITGPVAIRWLF